MTNFVLKENINSSSQILSSIPRGTIVPTIFSTIPDGWLECNGQEVLIGTSGTTYYDLYSQIGTAYGSLTDGAGGSGSTHFKVPNLSSKYLVPRISSDSNTYTGGSNNHQHLVTAAATSNNVTVNHNHNIAQSNYGGDYYAHNHSGAANIGANGTNPGNRNKTGTGGSGYAAGASHTHSAYTAGNTGYGSPGEHGHANPVYSYHNILSLGINSATATAHTHTSSAAGSNSISGYSSYYEVFPASYVVRYMIKV